MKSQWNAYTSLSLMPCNIISCLNFIPFFIPSSCPLSFFLSSSLIRHLFKTKDHKISWTVLIKRTRLTNQSIYQRPANQSANRPIKQTTSQPFNQLTNSNSQLTDQPINQTNSQPFNQLTNSNSQLTDQPINQTNSQPFNQFKRPTN